MTLDKFLMEEIHKMYEKKLQLFHQHGQGRDRESLKIPGNASDATRNANYRRPDTWLIEITGFVNVDGAYV